MRGGKRCRELRSTRGILEPSLKPPALIGIGGGDGSALARPGARRIAALDRRARRERRERRLRRALGLDLRGTRSGAWLSGARGEADAIRAVATTDPTCAGGA